MIGEYLGVVSKLPKDKNQERGLYQTGILAFVKPAGIIT